MIDLHPIGSLEIIMACEGDKNGHPKNRSLLIAIERPKK
tara:strand:- start:57361 stop:57477 length:117 start_codon:yes stop_codon:yes gene_type:complete